MKKKIGIIGSGLVAQTLAGGFLKHGYEVMLGTRDPAKLHEWKSKEHDQAKVGSVDAAAAFGEIVVLATKGSATESVVRNLATTLANKTVIDTTNPIADAAPENGVLKFITDLNGSLMEKLQRAAPEAHFVKAFNSVGSHLMVNPSFKGEKPTMFTCGDHETAKKEVHEVLQVFGWEIADMGKAEAARAIEPLCMLWCIPGFIRNEWGHAFRLLKS